MRNRMIFCLMLLCGTSMAQQAEPLVFREKMHDFGEVDEDRGVVDFEFQFTNSASRPIRVIKVDASCGCTIAGWTKEPVTPGKTGLIKASYNPAGRPGYFNKTLTVITDWDANPILLQIKGQVVSDKYSASISFPVAMGVLRLKSRALTMGKVYLNQPPVTREFPVMNSGSTPLSISAVEKPSYMTVDVPALLEPQQKGVIRITYNGKDKNQYGYSSDNITLTTNDPEEATKSISVFASIEEYFPPMTADELLQVPVLKIHEPEVDLGRFRSSTQTERIIWLRNTGKRELMIRSLQGNCPCITATMEAMVIKGGDSAAVKLVFKPQNRTGTQQKALTIYSNDPRNPVQRIGVQAFVVD
ncbi:MAG TPA: DUF1573 domain-containing protein [Cyclobacteriaceae bacterium]|nr:DUF1573 domain-containing protein [Cyclobacteriaceae bacterium]